jgi:hypothetical protein
MPYGVCGLRLTARIAWSIAPPANMPEQKSAASEPALRFRSLPVPSRIDSPLHLAILPRSPTQSRRPAPGPACVSSPSARECLRIVRRYRGWRTARTKVAAVRPPRVSTAATSVASTSPPGRPANRAGAAIQNVRRRSAGDHQNRDLLACRFGPMRHSPPSRLIASSLQCVTLKEVLVRARAPHAKEAHPA